MKHTENQQDQSASSRQRLLSARQLGWALTLATIMALVAGVVLVGGFLTGLGGRVTQPLQIESRDKPVAAPEPTFHILEPDNADQAGQSPSSIQRTQWIESLFKPRSSVTPAGGDDGGRGDGGHGLRVANDPQSDTPH